MEGESTHARFEGGAEERDERGGMDGERRGEGDRDATRNAREDEWCQESRSAAEPEQ